MLDSKNNQRYIGGSGKDQYLEPHWLYVVDIHTIKKIRNAAGSFTRELLKISYSSLRFLRLYRCSK